VVTLESPFPNRGSNRIQCLLGGVLIHDFTAFSHLILRIKVLLVGAGNGFKFKNGHTYLGNFFVISADILVYMKIYFACLPLSPFPRPPSKKFPRFTVTDTAI